MFFVYFEVIKTMNCVMIIKIGCFVMFFVGVTVFLEEGQGGKNGNS